MHSKLQEGLRYSVMSAPAVSGAQTYLELYLAMKKQGKTIIKRKHYFQEAHNTLIATQETSLHNMQETDKFHSHLPPYICNGMDHTAKYLRLLSHKAVGILHKMESPWPQLTQQLRKLRVVPQMMMHHSFQGRF